MKVVDIVSKGAPEDEEPTPTVADYIAELTKEEPIVDMVSGDYMIITDCDEHGLNVQSNVPKEDMIFLLERLKFAILLVDLDSKDDYDASPDCS